MIELIRPAVAVVWKFNSLKIAAVTDFYCWSSFKNGSQWIFFCKRWHAHNNDAVVIVVAVFLRQNVESGRPV